MVFGWLTSEQIPFDERKAIDQPDRRGHDPALRNAYKAQFISPENDTERYPMAYRNPPVWRTYCPRRRTAEITLGQLRRSVAAEGYFMEQ